MGCDIETTADGSLFFRVANHGIYDGICAFDYGTTVLVFIGVVANIAFALIGLYYRNWPPLRAKQPWLIALATVGGTLWAFGTLMTNSVSDQMVGGAFRRLCWLHRYLGQILGFTLWTACLLIRLWRLHAVLNRNTVPMATWKLLIFCLLPAVAIILAGIFRHSARPCTVIAGGHLDQVYVIDGQLVSQSAENELIDTCCLCTDWQFGLFAYCFVFYFLIIAGTFLLRNVRKSFNELRETTVTTVVAMAAFIMTAVVAFQPWVGTCVGRNIITIVTMISISVPTFLIAGPWVVGRLVHPKESEARFWAQMQAESQENADRGRPSSLADNYSIHSSSSGSSSMMQQAPLQPQQMPSQPSRLSTWSSLAPPTRSRVNSDVMTPPTRSHVNSDVTRIPAPLPSTSYASQRGISGPLSPRHHDRKPSADDDSFISLSGSMQ